MILNHLEDSKKQHFSEMTILIKNLNQKQDMIMLKNKGVIGLSKLDIINETNSEVIEMKQKWNKSGSYIGEFI